MVTIGNGSPLNTDFTNLTLAAWVYSNGTGGSDAQITGKGTTVYGLTHHTDGKIWFYINNGGNALTTALSTGAWHHVVATFENGTTMKIYMDGVYKTQRTSTSASTGTGGTFTIAGATSDFNGQIDDIRIYNYALTATQVKTLYNGGAVNFR